MDINSVDLMDLEDLEVVQTFRSNNRYRIRQNPFELDDEAFRSKYRFTKRFGQKIINLVKEDLDHDPRGQALDPELQVLCALRNWARHEIQDDTGDLHGVSQPAISKTCKKVADVLARMSSQFVKMPSTLNEQEAIMRGFRSIANFPRIIGAIDCTHIRIKKIRADGGALFINRKGFASINVQVVCDADLKIRDVVARWHGSVHDSRIFRECRLKQRFEAGAFAGLLLGDSGYPCMPYLLTPVLSPTTAAEERYNRSHVRTRNTIERCFGLWKQRFRCLLRGMYGNIETAKKTIVACAVLHNIAIDMGEDLFPGEDQHGELPSTIEQQIPVQSHISNSIRGTVRRRQFITTHFSN